MVDANYGSINSNGSYLLMNGTTKAGSLTPWLGTLPQAVPNSDISYTMSTPLYRARNGNPVNGEDPNKIYVERNLYASEALLGLSDHTTDSAGWALVATSSGSLSGTYNKLVLTDSSGANVLSQNGTVTQSMWNTMPNTDLRSLKPLILTYDSAACSGSSPTSLSVVKLGETRATSTATIPAGLGCN